MDPCRPAAKASIATAQSAGIRVRMITGDHAVTATTIYDPDRLRNLEGESNDELRSLIRSGPNADYAGRIAARQ